MRLSKRCEYGIKAVVRLAQARSTGYVQSRELAEAEALPAKFLESILLALRSAGILDSKVGAGGGYRLAKPAESVRVADLILALEPPQEASAEERGPPTRAGQWAVDHLHSKMDTAFESSVGSLTLSGLVTHATEMSNRTERSMYYI